jgi:hypothetical protein
MLGADFFEAKAVRFHENFILPGDAHRNMAENIIPMAFVGENIARKGELFFQLFDLSGHHISLRLVQKVQAGQTVQNEFGY